MGFEPTTSRSTVQRVTTELSPLCGLKSPVYWFFDKCCLTAVHSRFSSSPCTLAISCIVQLSEGRNFKTSSVLSCTELARRSLSTFLPPYCCCIFVLIFGNCFAAVDGLSIAACRARSESLFVDNYRVEQLFFLAQRLYSCSCPSHNTVSWVHTSRRADCWSRRKSLTNFCTRFYFLFILLGGGAGILSFSPAVWFPQFLLQSSRPVDHCWCNLLNNCHVRLETSTATTSLLSVEMHPPPLVYRIRPIDLCVRMGRTAEHDL